METPKVEVENGVTFFDIPHVDVIHRVILPHLSLKDLLQLRQASEQCAALVEDYWRNCRKVDLSSYKEDLTTEIFHAVTDDNCKIEVLNLSKCKSLTDDQIIPVLHSNPNLKHIDLSGCCITSSTIDALAQTCHHVEILYLKRCNRMTCSDLANLSSTCQNLTYINLKGCSLVRDLGVTKLAAQCKSLTTIVLANLAKITDFSLRAIAENSSELLLLDVSGCFGLTNYGIMLVAEYCKNLKSLKVIGCSGILDYSVNALKSQGLHLDLPQRPYPYDNISLCKWLGLRIQI